MIKDDCDNTLTDTTSAFTITASVTVMLLSLILL